MKNWLSLSVVLVLLFVLIGCTYGQPRNPMGRLDVAKTCQITQSNSDFKPVSVDFISQGTDSSGWHSEWHVVLKSNKPDSQVSGISVSIITNPLVENENVSDVHYVDNSISLYSGGNYSEGRMYETQFTLNFEQDGVPKTVIFSCKATPGNGVPV